MSWLLLGVAIFAWRTFWGLGLSWLLLPQRMRRYALFFAPLAGATLQMTVVWIGATLDLAGTVVYVWGASVVPVSLLGAAILKMGKTGLRLDLVRMRNLGGVIATALLALAILILPASQAGSDPTTVSLGGCDAGSYAAGAEALKNFPASDRTGFLGQAGPNLRMEALGLHDWWMQYDHFGPAALLAMTAALLDRDVFKILTIDAATYWAMLLPMVFWLARQGFGLRVRASMAVMVILALSPISQYVVHHGLLGQLLATGASVLLWWASAGLLRRSTGRRWWACVGWATVANALLIGSYAFFLPLIYAPVLIKVALSVVWPVAAKTSVAGTGKLEWGRAIGWSRGMGTALLISGGLFWSRIVALPYHYSDLSSHGYGWEIPRFNFAGLMGSFSDWQLTPSSPIVSGSIAIAAIAALGLSWRQGQLNRDWCGTLIGLAVGVILVYGLFLSGFLGGGKQSSYQAFKVIAVSYPLVFLVLAGGLRLLDAKSRVWQTAGGGLAILLGGANLHATLNLTERIGTAPLKVDSMLGAVRRINDMANVQSVNVLYPEVWPRLWSSAYLLTRHQYYADASYEGRPASPLAGAWDLSYASVRVIPAQETDQIWLNPMHHLTRREQAQKVVGTFVSGWHREEVLHHHRWRWSSGLGSIGLQNTTNAELSVTLKLTGARSVEGELIVRLNGAEMVRSNCSDKPGAVAEIVARLQPGQNVIEFDPGQGALRIDDTGRTLGFALYTLDVVLGE